jgi:hypothetical protein
MSRYGEGPQLLSVLKAFQLRETSLETRSNDREPLEVQW